MTTTWVFRNSMPRMFTVPSSAGIRGQAFTCSPYRPRTLLLMNSDAPMAVISGTRRGARRRGRYAIRSSRTATIMPLTAATASTMA